MGFRNGVAACAVSALAMVFSVQQGEHGPLVVYKLQVPGQGTPAASPAATPRSPHVSQPRLRSSITRVPQRPATRSATAPHPAQAPRSLGTVVMPASALPPPRVTPVVTPLVPPALAAPAPAALQPGILGTVAISDIEALTSNRPFLTAPVEAAGAKAAPFEPAFHVLEDAEFGTAMVNEETGESLTLQEVNDAVSWRRDTAERLRGVPIAPRF